MAGPVLFHKDLEAFVGGLRKISAEVLHCFLVHKLRVFRQSLIGNIRRLFPSPDALNDLRHLLSQLDIVHTNRGKTAVCHHGVRTAVDRDLLRISRGGVCCHSAGNGIVVAGIERFYSLAEKGFHRSLQFGDVGDGGLLIGNAVLVAVLLRRIDGRYRICLTGGVDETDLFAFRLEIVHQLHDLVSGDVVGDARDHFTSLSRQARCHRVRYCGKDDRGLFSVIDRFGCLGRGGGDGNDDVGLFALQVLKDGGEGRRVAVGVLRHDLNACILRKICDDSLPDLVQGSMGHGLDDGHSNLLSFRGSRRGLCRCGRSFRCVLRRCGRSPGYAASSASRKHRYQD